MENNLKKNGAYVDPEIIQKLVLEGDISRMNQQQRVEYYTRFCEQIGLNPLTQPFQIIKFQGKEKLYAMKDCTEQLRKIHGVSIIDITTQSISGVFVVTAKAQDKDGKTDVATGAVPIENLKGDNLANALMKAETKAKRRVTLSICGLGILDDSEIETIPNTQTSPVQLPVNDSENKPEEKKEPEKKEEKKQDPAKGKRVLDKMKGNDMTPDWIRVMQVIEAKTMTLDDIKKYYDMSPDIEKQVKAAIDTRDMLGEDAIHVAPDEKKDGIDELPFD